MNQEKKTSKTEKIILGIDPGTTIMGFGLIRVVGKKMHFLQLNELQLQKYKDHYLKLKLIFERTIEMIDNYHQDENAIVIISVIYWFSKLSHRQSVEIKVWRSTNKIQT